MGKLNFTRAANKVIGSWARHRSTYQKDMNRVKIAKNVAKIGRKNAKVDAKLKRKASKLDYKFNQAELIEKNKTIRQGIAQTGLNATQALATFGGKPKTGAITQNIGGGTTEKDDDDNVMDGHHITKDGPVNQNRSRRFSYSSREEE